MTLSLSSMFRRLSRQSPTRRILFFSFHYPPDQSAGAVRTSAIVHELVQHDPSAQVTVFCSVPRRYGIKPERAVLNTLEQAQIHIRRFWIPFFGQGPIPSVLAYVFYLAQSVPAAIWLRPHIIVGTSAKLLTSFVAACAARFTGAALYIDFRDTFADNYFYFYRWHKRILLQSLIMAIENLVLRSACSINMVSIGFQDAFWGWERILSKYSITLTNYPNGIHSAFRSRIVAAVANRCPNTQIYRIVYVGNLGEGQDLLGLLRDLAFRPDLLQRMSEARIRFDIFGSGPQVKGIEALAAEGESAVPPGPLEHLVSYRGLVPRDQVETIYAHADCLMLQLGLYSSLSMVIPSKIFEYAATPYPVLFGASGFTSSFINQISGTIRFEQCNAESFMAAIERSRTAIVDPDQRNRFLDRYDAGKIYSDYARHISGLNAPVFPAAE
jgi:hypothetical protein